MIDFTCPITDISPLIPHSGEMVMLDKITEFGEDYLIAEMTVKPDCLLLKDGKLATYMGAEILAQGVAAWAGCKCVKAGHSQIQHNHQIPIHHEEHQLIIHGYHLQIHHLHDYKNSLLSKA